MSDGEVKRWYLYTENEALYAVSKNQRGFVPDASTIEVMRVEDHERIVAELKAEIARLELVAMAAAESIKEKYKIMDTQKRVIEKLKTYVQHRVDCICRAGVLQYSEECDCGLEAIEKGEGT